MKTSEVLRGAADLVRKGWCRKAPWLRGNAPPPDNKTNWCAWGAIHDVSTSPEELNRAIDELTGYLSREDRAGNVVVWNDTYAADGTEVSSAMLACAAECEARGE